MRNPTYHTVWQFCGTILSVGKNIQSDDVLCKVPSHSAMDSPCCFLAESYIHCLEAEYNPEFHWCHKLCRLKHCSEKYRHGKALQRLLRNRLHFQLKDKNTRGSPVHPRQREFWYLARLLYAQQLYLPFFSPPLAL